MTQNTGQEKDFDTNSAAQTLETNRRQSEFYNKKKKKSLATKLWYSLRNGMLQDVRKQLGTERQIRNLHLSWFGDLSQKKVLDLGCYAGNSLSMHLAIHSREYVAIDLSEKGISSLRDRLKKIPTAKALTIDFLSGDFTEKNFDLIYAYGVLHHFKDTDLLIARLKEKLASNGEIISNDPLKTSFPVKMMRAAYRPFQSDKDWEWPFSKQTLKKFESEFEVRERRGMLGKAKWFFLLNLIPFSKVKKDTLIRKWHREDWEKSKNLDKRLFECMHVTMWMRKL